MKKNKVYSISDKYSTFYPILNYVDYRGVLNLITHFIELSSLRPLRIEEYKDLSFLLGSMCYWYKKDFLCDLGSYDYDTAMYIIDFHNKFCNVCNTLLSDIKYKKFWGSNVWKVK